MNNHQRDLYQDIIIDHGTHPRNKEVLVNANYGAEGFNPLCGDQLSLQLLVEKDCIKAAKFLGEGCAISTASASLMTQCLEGKTMDEAEEIAKEFLEMLTQTPENDHETLGKLTVLSGVSAYPARVKCATLAWRTLNAALQGDKNAVSTE
jgi:nitrogen fixation NifU-like protein